MTVPDVLIGFMVVVFVATVVVGGFAIAGIIRDLLMERLIRESGAPRRLSRITAARVQYGVLVAMVVTSILALVFIPPGVAYIVGAAFILTSALSVSITASYLSRGEPAKPAARAKPKPKPEPRPRRRLTQRAADRILLGTTMAGMFAMFPGSIPFIGHDDALQAWVAGIVSLMGAVLATTFYFAREYAPAKPRRRPIRMMRGRIQYNAATRRAAAIYAGRPRVDRFEWWRSVVLNVVGIVLLVWAIAAGRFTMLMCAGMAFSLPVFLHVDRRVGEQLEADPAPKPMPEPAPLPADALTGEDRAWFDLWGTNAGIPPELPAEPALGTSSSWRPATT